MHKWTDGDRVTKAVACLGAIGAICVSWIEKTPLWAGASIAVIAALLVYLLRFVPSGKARTLAAVSSLVLLGIFGSMIWPHKLKLPVATPQPQTVQPVPKTPPGVAPATPQDEADTKRHVQNPIEGEDEHTEQLTEVRERVQKLRSQYTAEHPDASPQEIVDGVNAQLKALNMKSNIYLEDRSKIKMPANLSQIERELLEQYYQSHPNDKLADNTLSAGAINHINRKLIARNIPWVITAPPGTPCTKNGIEIYSKEADLKNLQANGCFTGTGILINSDKLKLDGATVGGDSAKPQK